MKYIITESQYKLLTEEKILKLDFDVFNNDWNLLQRFLDKKGNPPYKIIGDLDLRGVDVVTLGSLVGVEGDLDLHGSKIKSLGNLKSVGGYLNLGYTKIESLGNLKSVGGYLNLMNTNITSLGNLQYVGSYLNLRDTPLSKTTTEEEIRSQVDVGGNINFF